MAGSRMVGITISFMFFGVCLGAPSDSEVSDGNSEWQHKKFTKAKDFILMDQASIPKLSNGVPKILHQTWLSDDILPQHRPFFDSWDKCLPDDWLHVLWTDDEADSFVRQNAPAEFLETYLMYVYPIQRIDTFRYVLLKVYGGVYADLDNECFANPEFPSMSTCNVYLAETCCGQDIVNQLERYTAETKKLVRADQVDRPIPNPVQNSLMVSTPNHPFWDDLLNLAVTNGPAKNFLQRWTGIAPIHSTVGVDLLSAANFMYGGDSKGVCELSKEDWHGGIEGAPAPRYAIHHGTHVWKSKAHNAKRIVIMSVLGVLVICCGGYTYFTYCSGSTDSAVEQATQLLTQVVGLFRQATPRTFALLLGFLFVTMLGWFYM
eukprot:m.261811 g.261811  ORF g.261811 m.261811 type:complete len:376 (+) comp43207_c0_seq1:155-1282(+)